MNVNLTPHLLQAEIAKGFDQLKQGKSAPLDMESAKKSAEVQSPQEETPPVDPDPIDQPYADWIRDSLNCSGLPLRQLTLRSRL